MHSKKVYLLSIAFTSALIFSFFAVQTIFIYKKLNASMLIAPSSLAIVLGLILGRYVLMRSELARKSFLFRAIADSGTELTYIKNRNQIFEYVSPSVLTITGYSQQEFYQNPDILSNIILLSDRVNWFYHLTKIEQKHGHESLDFRIQTKDGQVKWLRHTCSAVYDSNGHYLGLRSINLDITDRKNYEIKLDNMSKMDPLTNIPNRRFLYEIIEGNIKSNTSETFALLFLDLDRFKYINDSLGHSFGDKLLVEIALRMSQSCGQCQQFIDPQSAFPKNKNMIARFGGDEFVILLSTVKNKDEINFFIKQILQVFKKPFCVSSETLYVHASIGVAIFPSDGNNTEDLIKNADAAMYLAKKQGNNKVAFYDQSLSRFSSEFINSEKMIIRAIEEKQFILHYQPKIDLKSGLLVGVEALIRWQNPERGLLMPNNFLPTAEEIGLINDIGNIALAMVAKQQRIWRQHGWHIPVAVNISPKHLQEEELIETIQAILESGDMDGNSLEIEITEDSLIAEPRLAIEQIQKLKKMGIAISIDDFGTGFSSLSHLRVLPVDTLKIDMTFVRNILQKDNSKDIAIIKTIINYAKNFDLKTVAEGIEYQKQSDLLKELGCDIGQGYLFGRPLPSEQLEQDFLRLLNT